LIIHTNAPIWRNLHIFGPIDAIAMSISIADKIGSTAPGRTVARLSERLQRIIPLLACPDCRSDLEHLAGGLDCLGCHKSYPIRNNKIYFIQPLNAEDALDTIKLQLKRILGTSYYKIGVNILAPSYPFNYGAAIRKHVDPARGVIVDLGCGNFRVDERIITLDANDYDAVDVVASIEALPFKNDSLDAVCSRSVLEHVPDLMLAIREITRCTKSGGIGVHYIPFMYPFHASPYDYHRVTHVGAARLFLGWELLEQRGAAGPISLFLICLNEFVASLLSLGNSRIKAPIYLLTCMLTFPIKFLDIFFVGRQSFIGLAPTIVTAVRKPSMVDE
jgi:SAM-dependent methyltransferase